MKKKIVVFSGAGLDKESGIDTYRDIIDGLWYNYDPKEVATLDGWLNDREKVLEFHNTIVGKLSDIKPNEAHKLLAQLEEDYDVLHITQNVTNLLEQAGATNVIHLHGEITKARGSNYPNEPNLNYHVIDIGYEKINIGDKCPVTNSQLRPNLVWFGEYPHQYDKAISLITEADYLIVLGTSLEISYTLPMLSLVNDNCKIFFIDPKPVDYLEYYGLKVNYFRESASNGLRSLLNILKNIENEKNKVTLR